MSNTNRENAYELIHQFSVIQQRARVNADLLPCPRCGNYSLHPDLLCNSKSQYFSNLAVCDNCAEEEGMEMQGSQVALYLEDWALPIAHTKQQEKGQYHFSVYVPIAASMGKSPQHEAASPLKASIL